MPTLGEFTELEFRSVLLATLHGLADHARRGSITTAVMDIEGYLNETQDDETSPALLEMFHEHSLDEALRNYYATR